MLSGKKIPITYLSTLKKWEWEKGRREGGRKTDEGEGREGRGEEKRTYPNDESDCCTSRSCHDFCTIGDEIKKRRYNGFSAMIKLISQNCWKMATKDKKWFLKQFTIKYR